MKTKAEICAPEPKRKIGVCIRRTGEPGEQIKDERDACTAFKPWARQDRESFIALHLDANHRVIGVEEVSKGSLTATQVHPREVFKAAILSNAAAIIVAHNHPSGVAKPSKDDIDLTRRLVEASKLIGIPVLDHLVVTDKGCQSIGGAGSALGWHARRRR